MSLGFGASSRAATWVVHPDGTGDAPTIQAGIDSAAAGDTVLLVPGTYRGAGNHDLDFMGKAITVTSVAGAPATIIDCERSGRGFLFQRSEGPLSVLSGVTVRNGDSPGNGGGVFIRASSPTIEDNVFELGVAQSGGGILCTTGSFPVIRNNVIEENVARFYGGGICCDNLAFPRLIANTIRGNTATSGGAIACLFNSDPSITDCVLSGNSATQGGGISCIQSSPEIMTCTIGENDAATGGGIWGDGPSNPTIDHSIIAFSTGGGAMVCAGSPTTSCSDLFGNAGGDALCGIDGGGNTSADPQFCGGPGSANYFLQSDSPCAAANNVCVVRAGALDIGCSTTSVEPSSWGRIKRMYRD